MGKDLTKLYGQYFPFLVRDVYGSPVIPEQLGNVAPVPFNNHPARGDSGLPPRSRRALAAALLLMSVAGCSASQSGWTVTVYYTAVESFHHDAPQTVRGCPILDCQAGTTDLGSYPADFVAAVHDEGSGRITSSPHTGKFLNWSHDTGFWLDSAPRDTKGQPLQPFYSAAADDLPPGTTVRLTGCGRSEDAAVCSRLSEPTWTISDAFTPGLGGHQHIDLYIGEETGPKFTDDPMYTTLVDASLRIG